MSHVTRVVQYIHCTAQWTYLPWSWMWRQNIFRNCSCSVFRPATQFALEHPFLLQNLALPLIYMRESAKFWSRNGDSSICGLTLGNMEMVLRAHLPFHHATPASGKTFRRPLVIYRVSIYVSASTFVSVVANDSYSMWSSVWGGFERIYSGLETAAVTVGSFSSERSSIMEYIRIVLLTSQTDYWWWDQFYHIELLVLQSLEDTSTKS